MPECIYHVSTSASQKIILGFMGTSLVINFGILIWWVRLYCYKRKVRKLETQAESDEYPDESDTEDVGKDCRSANKEVESLYMLYRPAVYKPESDRDSALARARAPIPSKDDRSVNLSLRKGLGNTREVMDDRDTDDRAVVGMAKQRDTIADVRQKRKAGRREKEGPRSDISDSDSAEASRKTEKRRRIRGIDTPAEEK